MPSKLEEFAAKKKSQLIYTIKHTSALGILFNWLIANRYVVISIIIALVFVGRFYYMETELLRQRNSALIEERDAILNRTKILEGKVLELRRQTEEARKKNQQVRKEAEKMTSQQKKDEILRLIDVLKRKRK